MRLHRNRAIVDGEKITKALKFEFGCKWRGSADFSQQSRAALRNVLKISAPFHVTQFARDSNVTTGHFLLRVAL